MKELEFVKGILIDAKPRGRRKMHSAGSKTFPVMVRVLGADWFVVFTMSGHTQCFGVTRYTLLKYV